jgi:hypothetical protein
MSRAFTTKPALEPKVCKWCYKLECECVKDQGMQAAVSCQKHYTESKIQHIQYAEENGLGWCEGNITKYVTRYKRKNGGEDLRKAASYLKVLIYKVENGVLKTPDELEKEGFKI